MDSTDKKYFVQWGEEVEEQIHSFRKSGNKFAVKKIEQFVNELEMHPFTGTGKPEPLKHNLSGMWSRRIDQKNRLVYSVDEEIITIDIISVKGHYYDK